MSSSLRLILNTTLRLDKCRIFNTRYYSSDVTNTGKYDTVDITSCEETPKYAESSILLEPEEIMEKRNKSKLTVHDRNVLNDVAPYNEDLMWFHETIRYKRRMLGRYGKKSLRNVPVGALWPLKDEIEDKLEYERVLYRSTLQEDWASIAKRNRENEERIRLRDEEIVGKMAKLGQWQKEYHAKIAKKEADIKAAREKRERLVEDIRREFGFKIDPRDDRFKEALAKKEKEDRKRKKEARKENKNARFMAQLLAQANADKSEVQPKQTTEEKKE